MAVEEFVPSTATSVQENQAHKSGAAHPLDPLSPDEIVAVSLSVRRYTAAKTPIKAIRFITCSLLPPPKRDVLAFLGIPLAPGEKPKPFQRAIVRRAEVDFVDVVNGHSYNLFLSLKSQEWHVDEITQLPDGIQPQITPEELIACEDILRADPRVCKLAADVGVKPEELYADGWAIGYDERFPKHMRIQQALLFARYSTHDNLYAHPMDFIPVIDSNARKVIHIDFPPTYKTNETTGNADLSVDTTAPPPLTGDFATPNRPRIPPPREAFDFLPDLQEKKGDGFKLRDDIKPLHIIQPEGVSFKMDGNVLTWQKWSMHISFTHREGIAISTITYNDDGEIRPLFYRLSLAEMIVPYAAPEFPHPRKFAFDSGEYGMGTMANELSLGCDCLGQIHYLPGSYVAHDGSAVVIKNVICIHEEDAGLLWKHTDFRPGGRSQAVRSRRLVVSMTCTLANYEYNYRICCLQDGSIDFEVQLTGIVQAYAGGDNNQNPFGTTVAPGVLAQHHQHLFSIRIDPMVDGLANAVVESDILPLPNAPTGSTSNFAGNAFVVHEKTLKTAAEGARDYSWETDRRWRVVNRARKHYASGKHVGYSIHAKGGMTGMLAQADSWIAKRASFPKKALWVVPDADTDGRGSRMWPAGKFMPGSREEADDSVAGWTKKDGSIEDEDIVLFLTVGTTHITRPEDWPVMPVEHLNVGLKPSHFFSMNPSMDVPGNKKDEKSVPAFGSGSHCSSC